ncbi:MAG: hypothetical protein ABI835_00590 [Chloroflexota bacterium]
MAEQNVQLIAMVPQEDEINSTPDIQRVLFQHLERKYQFQQKRFQTALAYSATGTLAVFLALIVSFGLNFFGVTRLPEQFRLYAPFIDWSSTTEYKVCDWSCEIRTQGTRLVKAAADIGASVLADEDAYYGSVAGIARLCTLIAVSVTVWCAYRKQLAEYYEINAQPAQLEDFRETPRWQFWLSRGLYTAASLFGTYVVISIVWLGLSVIFKNVTLDRLNAAIVIVIFTGTVTFAAAYGALAATTRDVLLLGLFTFVFGFCASFALSPLIEGRQWWERAVSNAGQLNPSAPLFTGTLLSGSIALWMLWYDINGVIEQMIADGKIVRWDATTWQRIARGLYAGLIIGLISVGLVRVDDANFPGNKVFHAGGAVLAILSVVAAGYMIRKQRFHPWYRFLSIHILLGATVLLAVFGSFRFDPPGFVATGTGMISLTVIELTLFILIGVWVYVTVDNLLGQANINAFKGQVVMVTQAAAPAASDEASRPAPTSRLP